MRTLVVSRLWVASGCVKLEAANHIMNQILEFNYEVKLSQAFGESPT